MLNIAKLCLLALCAILVTGQDQVQDTQEPIYQETSAQEAVEDRQMDQDQIEATSSEEQTGGAAWLPREKAICNLKSFSRPGPLPNQYYECLKPTDDPVSWPWTDIGVWHLQNCTRAGFMFSPVDRVCRRPSSVRRSEQSFCLKWPEYCKEEGHVAHGEPSKHPGRGYGDGYGDSYGAAPYNDYGYESEPCEGYNCGGAPHGGAPHGGGYGYDKPVIPRPCPLAKDSYGASPGGICSWMLDPLAAVGGNYHYYLQCTPYPPGIYCGRWLKRPCADGTRFDVTVQVCVHDEHAPPKPYYGAGPHHGGGDGYGPGPGPHHGGDGYGPGAGPDYHSEPVPYVQSAAASKTAVVARREQSMSHSAVSSASASAGTATGASQCTSGTVPIGSCNQFNACPGYSTCQLDIKMCCQPSYDNGE